MPRNQVFSEARIVIDLPVGGMWGVNSEKEARQDGEEMCSQIVRHVDLPRYAKPYTEILYEGVCSFCGAAWTEAEDSTHNGGCCEEDAKAYYAEHPEEVV